MKYSIFKFTLDLHSVQSQMSIPAFLGDTSITLRINLSDGVRQYTIDDGCLAKLSIKRPTGTYIEQFCAIDGNTTIVYPFNENTALVEGIHDCDITLYDADGGKLGSPRFTLVVSDKVVNRDDIILTDEDFTAVDAMLQEEAKRQVGYEQIMQSEANREEVLTSILADEQSRKNAEAERVANEEARVNAGATAMNAVARAEEAAVKAEEAKERTEELLDEYITDVDVLIGGDG